MLLQENRKAVVSLVGTYRTEVDQADFAVLCQEQVIRADISVDQVLCMEGSQCAEQIGKSGLQKAPGHGTVPLQVSTQIDAIQVFHGVVNSSVFGKPVVHTHNIAFFAQFLQKFRLILETLDQSFKIFLLAIQDLDCDVIHFPAYIFAGIQFLQGNTFVVNRVPGRIGNTETAVTQHLTDYIPLLQQSKQRQRIRTALIGGCLGMVATAADPVRSGRKAPLAATGE